MERILQRLAADDSWNKITIVLEGNRSYNRVDDITDVGDGMFVLDYLYKGRFPKTAYIFAENVTDVIIDGDLS